MNKLLTSGDQAAKTEPNEVPNIAVFCSSLISCFPGTLLGYFLNDFQMVPVVLTITGITFVLIFQMHCIYIVRSLHFKLFSASFIVTFLSAQIATSINIHVLYSISQIIMCGILLGIIIIIIIIVIYLYAFYIILLLFGIYNPYEFQPPPSGGSEITHKDTPQSVGLLWTSDQPVAETST
jgi:hypothetical protein